MFTKQNLWLSVGGLLVASSFCLPFLALSFFWFGYYYQATPVIFGFWILVGSIALWAIATPKQYRQQLYTAFNHPLVTTQILLALVTAVFSPLHNTPLMSWTGTPQMGEGVLFFIGLAMLALLYRILLPNVKSLKYAFYAAMILGLITSTMGILGSPTSPIPSLRSWKWAPYFFSDYVAFVALSFIVLYAFMIEKSHHDNRYGKIQYAIKHVIGLSSLIFLTYYSYNKGLWYSIFLATMGVGAAFFIFRTRERWSKFLPWAAIAIAISFMLVIGFVYPKLSHQDPSLLSRSTLIQYTFYPFFDLSQWQQWLQLAFGRGWGSFGDFVTANMFISPETTLFNYDEWNPSEEAINRDFFHSHNLFAELFLSIGLIGTFIYFYCFYKIVKSFNKKLIWLGTIFLFAYILVNSLWFQLTVTIPYSIFAFTLLCADPSNKQYSQFGKGPIYGTLFLTFILFALFTPLMFMSTTHIEQESHLLKIERYDYKMARVMHDPWLQYERLTGNKHLSQLFRDQTISAMNHAGKEDAFPLQEVFDTNLQIAKYLAGGQTCNSPYLSSTALNIYGEMASLKRFGPLILRHPTYFEDWAKLARKYLSCTPKRTDMLVPYFNRMVMMNKETEARRLINLILHNNPEDPVALWFSGSFKINHHHSSLEGVAELKRSVRNGVQRFIPLSKEQLEMLQS